MLKTKGKIQVGIYLISVLMMGVVGIASAISVIGANFPELSQTDVQTLISIPCIIIIPVTLIVGKLMQVMSKKLLAVIGMIPVSYTHLDVYKRQGQDSKVIELSEQGVVERFEMNDKCAAGTGRFFEVLTHRLLGIKMEELSDLMKKSKNACTISSMCTIFAESEIISYLSQKIPIEDIAAGTGRSIARRILAMGRSAQIQYLEPIVFSGGVANNEAITDIFAELLGKPVTAVKMPQSTAALGAALRAHKEYDKLQSA